MVDDEPKDIQPFCGEIVILDAISLGATHSVETWDLGEDFWQPEGRGSTIATFTKLSCSISSPPTPNAPEGRRDRRQLLNNEYYQQGPMCIWIVL